MPGMRSRKAGDYADHRLSVLLRMRKLQDHTASEVGRLLCVLLVRLGEVPSDTVVKYLTPPFGINWNMPTALSLYAASCL